MKKKVIGPILCFIFIIAVVFGTLYVVDHHRMDNNEPVVFSTWGYDYAPPEENTDDTTTINEYDEAYNPDEEQSFVGKVIEETTTYMIVEPAEDEYERTLTQRMMVAYDTDHVDYLYGAGRLVVIYYDADNMIKGGEMPIIESAEISTEGFCEWELKVTPTKLESHKILAVPKAAPHDSDSASHWYKQYNLYYYDLDEVMVSVDGSEYPLAHAIKLGKISMSAILAKANRDVADGVIEEISYDDGGSSVFKYPDYTIVKYHTLDGNDDMYIGTPDIDIHVKDK